MIRKNAGVAKARVLVVDDISEIAEVVAAALGRAGYDTGVAADGNTGLARAEARDPDVLELSLPDLDGIGGGRR